MRFYSIALIAAVFLLGAACGNHKDSHGNECFSPRWDTSSDDGACWKECVFRAASSRNPNYNRDLCVRDACGYKRVCP